jgi:threonylcarbamoyladenosine tRNA methylthiotransferase MtaB
MTARATVERRNGKPRVAFATFGCKLNQWDTQVLERRVRDRCSVVDIHGQADAYVINTCTVTGSSDAQARRLIRRIMRERPGACVFVTGCYAERAPDEISSMGDAVRVLGNSEKGRLAGLLTEGSIEEASDENRSGGPGPAAGRSRAHAAIQRGCDRGCTYCIVPSVRGPARSFTPREVAAQVEDLLDEGYREIVLTGTYLGDYGSDPEGSKDLAWLVRYLSVVVAGSARLRLSSLGPSDITEDLVDAVGHSENVCRHFHVAFQSGDDGVLAAMRRGYDARRVRSALNLLKGAFPDCGLGGDAMVGFPGEGDDAFGRTAAIVEEFPFSYLHVFVFSARPGTPAAAYGRKVSPEAAKSRSRELRAIARRRAGDFSRRFVGRRVEVAAEGPSRKRGWLEGTSREYLRVRFKGEDGLKGRLIPVQVEGAISGRLVSGSIPSN